MKEVSNNIWKQLMTQHWQPDSNCGWTLILNNEYYRKWKSDIYYQGDSTQKFPMPMVYSTFTK